MRLKGRSGVPGTDELVSRAVCVPMKARKRNMKVPQNSPKMTTNSLRRGSGNRWRLAPVVWSLVPRTLKTDLNLDMRAMMSSLSQKKEL
jgi:hypothetical protein